MTITIPSYKRAGKVTTLDFLGDVFSKSEIIIGTQNKEDYKAYSDLYGDKATIIYKEGNSVGENRNNLLEYCQEHGITECLQLDDDMRCVVTKDKKKLKGKEFRNLMEKCFSLCRENGVTMFGGYCCENPFMMSNTAKPNLIVGMLCGILDTSIRYDANFRIKEDYELSLRLMSRGKRVIRFNSFGASAAHKTAGGCSADWKSEDFQKWAQLLVDAYPDLVKLNPSKIGEIKFIGK